MYVQYVRVCPKRGCICMMMAYDARSARSLILGLVRPLLFFSCTERVKDVPVTGIHTNTRALDEDIIFPLVDMHATTTAAAARGDLKCQKNRTENLILDAESKNSCSVCVVVDAWYPAACGPLLFRFTSSMYQYDICTRK